jgi:hypothetical protein
VFIRARGVEVQKVPEISLAFGVTGTEIRNPAKSGVASILVVIRSLPKVYPPKAFRPAVSMAWQVLYDLVYWLIIWGTRHRRAPALEELFLLNPDDL